MRGWLSAGMVAGVLAVGTPSSAVAQVGAGRGWIDVNFGMASAAGSRFEQRVVIDQDDEPADYGAAYRLPSGGAFDIGGGVMLNRHLGFGLSIAGTAFEDAADLSIRIPHPLFFSAFATDSSTTEAALRRREGAVHLQVMTVVHDRGGLRLRVFAGPSRLAITQELVDNIRYSQTYGLFLPSNTVRITEYESEDVEAGGWGFHLGADVAFFFSRAAGVGGFVRLVRGTVELDDPFDRSVLRLKGGGVQAGGGIRFRF